MMLKNVLMRRMLVLSVGLAASCGWASTVASAASAREFIVGIADICRTNDLCEVGPNYPSAVYAAGAMPYVLPCTTNAEAIAALLDCVDMLLLAGGEDVEPARYGEKPDPKLGKVNLRRDAWEFALVAEARKRRLPILGICRGCQVLNVAFGGTLWQDLPSQKKGAAIHRLNGVEHGIATVKGSYLAGLAGETCSVNTYHHQAVKDLARGFKVSATSPDGVVEAIEGTDYPAVGVQFHPEMLFAKAGRREFLPLFRGAFAKGAAGRAASRRRKLVLIPDYCATNRVTNAKISMSDAIVLAGFASVVLPFTEDQAKIDAAVADADALMIAGGMGKRQDYKRRCAFEDRTLKPALARKMPIAGVCHGSQIINKFMGGTLEFTPQWKDKEKKADILHRPVPWTDDNYHMTDLVEGSRFARIMGERQVRINSYHTMRSVKMAEGLKVTARSSDGVVEAFEHETLPIMAFQFHPERMTEDPRFVALMRAALSDLKENSK